MVRVEALKVPVWVPGAASAAVEGAVGFEPPQPTATAVSADATMERERRAIREFNTTGSWGNPVNEIVSGSRSYCVVGVSSCQLRNVTVLLITRLVVFVR